MECQFCSKDFGKHNHPKHEKACKQNPANLKSCIECGKNFHPHKRDGKEQITCSYSCSNKHFRSGENNGNWKETQYRTTCFLYHKKECIICKEKNIVAVHHYNENHNDNRPENLVPMCPTHHQYMHSNFKNIIIKQVDEYVEKYRGLAKPGYRACFGSMRPSVRI